MVRPFTKHLVNALDGHRDGACDRRGELFAEFLNVTLLAADQEQSLRQAAQALGHGQNPIRVGQVNVGHGRRLADFGFDQEERSRRRPSIDSVDNDQAIAADHELLHESHPADAALEHLHPRRQAIQSRCHRVTEAVIAAQHIANAGNENAPCIVQAKESILMSELDPLLDEMERLLAALEECGESVQAQVFALLDGVDALHRHALGRLAPLLGSEQVERLRNGDPAVAWLFEAYAVGVDERAAAETALESVRPYLHSHGGDVAVLGAHAGVVTVRLSGACSGCTASTITLRRGVEEALREGFPGFAAMEVEQPQDALPHPPPGPTLLQIAAYPAPAGNRPVAG